MMNSKEALKNMIDAVKASTAISLLDSFIPKKMKAHGIRGLSVAVADENGALWTAGYGHADGSGKRPFDATTISSVGSVSKLITATAVMHLVQQRKVDLDAPILRYLPDFHPRDGGHDVSAVTVRLLLSHHSGLQSDDFKAWSHGTEMPPGYPRPYANSVSLASKTTLCAKPGSVMAYSNLGYSLLGLMVEKVSGKDFASYVREAILDPLGMDSSSFVIEGRFSSRYARGKRGLRKNVGFPLIRDMPAGAFLTSAEDMGKLLSAVISSANGTKCGPLAPSTQREMWSRQNNGVVLDLDFTIGLGWWLTPLQSMPGESIVQHGGDLDPFCAFAGVIPTRSLGVFVMANSAKGFGSLTLGNSVAADVLRVFATAKGGPAIAAEPPAPTTAPMPPDLAARLVGNYATPMGLLCIKKRGRTFAVKSVGKWMEGHYRTNGSFGLRAKVLGIELPIAALKELSLTPESVDGQTAIAFRACGTSLGVGLRVKPGTLSSAWLSRSGAWEPIDRERAPEIRRARLDLDRDTGLFLLSLRFQMGDLAHPLRVISDREAIFEGAGRNLGTAVNVVEENGAEVMTVFGVRFRKGKSSSIRKPLENTA